MKRACHKMFNTAIMLVVVFGICSIISTVTLYIMVPNGNGICVDITHEDKYYYEMMVYDSSIEISKINVTSSFPNKCMLGEICKFEKFEGKWRFIHIPSFKISMYVMLVLLCLFFLILIIYIVVRCLLVKYFYSYFFTPLDSDSEDDCCDNFRKQNYEREEIYFRKEEKSDLYNKEEIMYKSFESDEEQFSNKDKSNKNIFEDIDLSSPRKPNIEKSNKITPKLKRENLKPLRQKNIPEKKSSTIGILITPRKEKKIRIPKLNIEKI